ncbi:hypothetical protein MN116_005454 [Schistosoma mekongi]|uniref:Uncharacterized protein n=1 Tax=Schistosoma mekongi TaxID=38744 RepID=A0AAE1ZDY5_SCHME|nr:hypothetical protein MN116_005454 [Schistosoma mekongi]
MIDKRFMPSSFITDSNEREQAWKNFAVGVACYAYKTVGEHFPKEFKILLANSAAVIVFSGLLAECETTQSLLKCKLNSFSEKNNIELQENNNELDKYAEYEPDGEWFYGSWTSDNLASVGEMESVIQQDISDFCAKLINITMESYYYTNRFYPPDITTYPREIISHKLMVKYELDSLLKQRYSMNNQLSKKFLKNFLPNDSSFNVTLLIECWKLYNVNNNEIEKILVYFSSINYNRIRDRLNRN